MKSQRSKKDSISINKIKIYTYVRFTRQTESIWSINDPTMIEVEDENQNFIAEDS